MSFSTNWDVDKYHDPSEFIEHWNLRKEFILTHKNNFPEDRLVGLAKIFYNMEFLGCVYNSELMILVQNLAREVDAIVQYRNKKKMKLQRTFVKASDAVKRHIEKSNTTTSNSKIGYVNFVAAENIKEEEEVGNKRLKFGTFIEKPELQKHPKLKQEQQQQQQQQQQQPQPGTLSKTQQRKQAKQQLKQRNQEKDKYKLRFDLKPEDRNLIMKVKNQNGVLGKLVLYETPSHATSYGRLYYATSKININMKIVKEEEKYILYMDNEIITEMPIPQLPALNRRVPTGHRKIKVPEEVRNLISDIAIEHLKQYCFTLIDHNTKDFEQISTDNLKNKKQQQKQQFELSMDGIGAKMMKQMGWGGKGLGKDASGIIEPIQAEVRVYRRGFGQGSDEEFTKSVREYFENYLVSGETKRLVFSTDFSKDDRAKLHLIAGQFGLLRSRSYGQGDNRHITIERKLSGWDIIEQVLANGGSNDCYSLVKPTNIH